MLQCVLQYVLRCVLQRVLQCELLPSVLDFDCVFWGGSCSIEGSGVVQCGVVCCGVVHCVAVWLSMVHSVAECCGVLQCVLLESLALVLLGAYD